MAALFKRSAVAGRYWFFFIILSILLLFFDHRSNSFTHQIRLILSVPLELVQVLVNKPFEWTQQLTENLSSHENLIQENQLLREKSALYAAQLTKLQALQMENKAFHSLLKTAPQIDGKVSGVEIRAVTIQAGKQTLLINKGKSDSVFIGQPVLNAQGLIGQIIRVDWYESVVLLITDLKSAVPVEVLGSAERGILVGTGSVNTLKLNNLSKTSKIKKGDILITSGLGGHFPPGYPVGRVRKVKMVSTDMFSQVIVSPMSDLGANQPLFLLWPNPKPLSFIQPIS
jgi:rod shape-determining protein MreC